MKLTPLRSSLLIAAVGLLFFFFQERIEVPLWDGALYVSLAKGPLEAVAEGVTPYQLQRILPSVVVHGILTVTGLPMSDAHIISAFAFLHVLQFALTAYFFTRSLELLDLDNRAKALGLVFAFASYFALKSSFVYPSLTDPSAYLVGTAMCCCYLSQNLWGLFCWAAVGLFCWPLTLFYALPLLLFGKRDLDSAKQLLTFDLPRSWWGPALVALLFIALPMLYPAPFEHFTERFPSQALYAAFEYLTPLLNLSVLIALVYLVGGTYHLFNRWGLLALRNWLGDRLPLRLTLILALLLLWQLPRVLGVDEGYGHHVEAGQFLYLLGIFPIVKPGIFLIAHIAYLGMVCCFAIMLWPDMAARIRKQGLGMVLAAWFTVLLALNPESRQLALSQAFLLPFVTAAASRFLRDKTQIAFVLLICLLQSRFWFPTTYWDPSVEATVLLERVHLSGIGPWMTNKDWLLHALIGALTWSLAYILCFRVKPRRGLIDVRECTE